MWRFLKSIDQKINLSEGYLLHENEKHIINFDCSYYAIKLPFVENLLWFISINHLDRLKDLNYEIIDVIKIEI